MALGLIGLRGTIQGLALVVERVWGFGVRTSCLGLIARSKYTALAA